MPDRRSNLIAAFALRFLHDNLDSEIEEALDNSLNSEIEPSLNGEDELLEIADSYFDGKDK